MSKELKMEVFASKEPVKSVRLHVYEFHTSELYENKYRLIRSAAWKIRNVNACGVFEDGSYIYTTEKISEEIPNVNFRLTYLGEQELGVLEHKKVYSELIKHWIIQKLRTVKIQKNSKEYYKYACRSNVTSRWIQTEQGFQTFYSGNRQISLERKYNFTVKILDDGRAYLKIDTSSVFLSNQTVYDYIKEIIHWIADMASKMDAVVIVALITGTVSIIGVIISSIVAKIIDYKKSRQEYLAKKREIPYGEFVEMIYKVQGNIKSEGSYTEKMMMDDLSKFSKQITLWGSSRVVNKWVKFREEGANPNAKSDNLFLMEDIMNEMRKDLGMKKVKKGNLLAFFVNDIKSILKK